MSSAVCGVDSSQPQDVVEDRSSLKEEEVASQRWNEEHSANNSEESIQKNVGENEQYTETMLSKGEDNFVHLQRNTKEDENALNQVTPSSMEGNLKTLGVEAANNSTLTPERNKNSEFKLENSIFVEKSVHNLDRTTEISNQFSYPVGTVSLTPYAPNAPFISQETAKRIPSYCYATQHSLIGIPTWMSSQTSNPTNAEIPPELSSIHSYPLTNDFHAVDEEARSASLVLLKLKSVTGEDGFELPTFRRKKWKKENVVYSQNKEESRPWGHRTFGKDMQFPENTDATCRSWKRARRSHESGVIPPQTEVACRVKEEEGNEWTWVLGIVDSYSNSSGQYRIIDIEELGNEHSSKERYYFVSPENVIPLSNDTKHVLPAETRVLAIYPDTTVFYPATIRSSRKTGKQLYYALEFDDEDEDEEIVKHVPARYVIIIPE